MRVKVRGGTADGGQRSLCETCRWSTIIRGTRLGEEIVECAQLSQENQRVRFRVASCSDYKDRSQPELRAMEEIAWILRSDPRRNQIGFVKKSQLAPHERDLLGE